MFENILKLELETKGFKEEEFLNLKKITMGKQSELSQIDQEMGRMLEKIDLAKKEVDEIKKIIKVIKTIETSLKISKS